MACRSPCVADLSQSWAVYEWLSRAKWLLTSKCTWAHDPLAMKTLTLTQWIERVGYAAAGKILDEKRETLVSWKLKRRTPRPEKARKICRRTKGVVTMAGIYG